MTLGDQDRPFSPHWISPQDFGRCLWIFNSVTLATRVRIEILWAIAKKSSNEKEIASVLSYSSRPTLLIKDREGKRRPMNFGFSDAVKRYGRILREGDLSSAYRKAGTSFEGQLQQNFVVLHDLNQAKPGPWGGKWGLVARDIGVHNLPQSFNTFNIFYKLSC